MSVAAVINLPYRSKKERQLSLWTLSPFYYE